VSARSFKLGGDYICSSIRVHTRKLRWTNTQKSASFLPGDACLHGLLINTVTIVIELKCRPTRTSRRAHKDNMDLGLRMSAVR